VGPNYEASSASLKWYGRGAWQVRGRHVPPPACGPGSGLYRQARSTSRGVRPARAARGGVGPAKAKGTRGGCLGGLGGAAALIPAWSPLAHLFAPMKALYWPKVGYVNQLCSAY